ncbi:unnamed protein product [Rangifer tarandus platyrhynchus]|uniref:Uncharacterized protein n=1 Tax=Rangifer tarandus platyrhynchus TaxID=3082113 RepID=A0AC59ZWK3_RANTA
MVSVPRNYSAMRPPHTREAESPLPGCPALSRATPWETDSKASPGVGSSLSTAASSSGAPFGTENLESEMRNQCCCSSSDPKWTESVASSIYSTEEQVLRGRDAEKMYILETR